MNIKIEKDVKEYMEKQGKDFRVCTSCSGPALVPTDYSSPKMTDIKVKMGDRTLYISKVQAPFLEKIGMDMLDVSSCSLFNGK